MSKITDIVEDLRNIEGLVQPAQEQLISGTNIKTINGSSVLGSGNIITPTTTLASVAPLVAGTAAVGVSSAAARGDHVHPAQTTITGNAATATKLAATKTISGVAFDGSANINIEDRLGTPIASAATTTVGTSGLGDYIHITGTTAITSLGTATTAGIRRTLIFDGALTLTHNATSLICPGAANIVTVAGTVIEVVAETTANWRVVSVTHPSVSIAELGYLDGVTSSIQTQLNAKAPLISPSFTTPALGVATGTSFNSITGLASVAPLANGTATVGTSTLAARQDHVHPADTTKQDTLVSGTNIKTVNGTTLLGSGDVVVSSNNIIAEVTLGTAVTTINITGLSLTYGVPYGFGIYIPSTDNGGLRPKLLINGVTTGVYDTSVASNSTSFTPFTSVTGFSKGLCLGRFIVGSDNTVFIETVAQSFDASNLQGSKDTHSCIFRGEGSPITQISMSGGTYIFGIGTTFKIYKEA